MPLRLVMLSPYRMPTHHALMLGDADTLAWQNAWRLLWHHTPTFPGSVAGKRSCFRA